MMDDLSHNRALQREIREPLLALFRESTLCELSWVPPQQCSLVRTTGRIVSLGEAWLEMSAYAWEEDLPTGAEFGTMALFRQTMFIPVLSVVSVVTGETPLIRRVEAMLRDEREVLESCWLLSEFPSQDGMGPSPFAVCEHASMDTPPYPPPSPLAWTEELRRWFRFKSPLSEL